METALRAEWFPVSSTIVARPRASPRVLCLNGQAQSNSWSALPQQPGPEQLPECSAVVAWPTASPSFWHHCGQARSHSWHHWARSIIFLNECILFVCFYFKLISTVGSLEVEKKYGRLLNNLSHPPAFTTVRVNTHLTSVEHVRSLLSEEICKVCAAPQSVFQLVKPLAV